MPNHEDMAANLAYYTQVKNVFIIMIWFGVPTWEYTAANLTCYTQVNTIYGLV